MMKSKINIRPTSSVYSTYKRLSYQPWTAIAEFVDNSTQSYYDNSAQLEGLVNFNKLIVEITYEQDNVDGDILTIKDNAFGMELEDFERAIVLDSPPKDTGGRNEFGMGLKTAACWFGSFWSVESTQLGSDYGYSASIDVRKLAIDRDEEIDLDIFEAGKNEHYTIITIRQLNKKLTGSRTIAKVKELLSSIYREDLRSGKITLLYNGTELQFKDPDIYMDILSDGTKHEWKKSVSFSINHEGQKLDVHGFVAIRMPASVKDAGLTLLRRGRVIIGGSEKNYRPAELFGDNNSFAYQRIFGELHMDNWPVTQAKDDFDWHSGGLEEIFIQKLLDYTKPLRAKAESIRVRQKVVTDEVLTNAISGLQSAGIIEDFSVEIPVEDNKGSTINIPTVQNITTTYDESEITETSSETGILVSGPEILSTSFKYKDDLYQLIIELESQNPLSQWVYITKLDINKYNIKLNMKHPFFKPFIDNKDFIRLMIQFVIALALSEIESLKISPDGRIDAYDIRNGMNKILETIAFNGGVI